MRRLLPTALVLSAVLLALPATAKSPNPWLSPQRSFINMAHQGGEDEFPSNTMYAYKSALAAGADTLEIDVNRTKDNKFVVMHDWKVDRTTNGTGYTTDMTVAEIQALDAAYNFIPGRNAVAGEPESSYPFRGVRTGAKAPPPGFTADDFRVPTLHEVLAAFPDTPINIEIKGQEDDEDEFVRNAELLAKDLKDIGRSDLIVVSFNQAAVDRFHELAPEIGIAPGLAGLVGHYLEGKPMPNADAVVAIQVPIKYGDIEALTPGRVLDAHKKGWAVHIWLSGGEENAEVYNDLLDHCVDGIMPAAPKALERVLKKRKVVGPSRPGGVDPCGAGLKSLTADRDEIDLVLNRRGVVPEAYRGFVSLISGRKLLGGSKFAFKNGKAKTGAVGLNLRAAGVKLLREGEAFKATLVIDTAGRRAPLKKRVTVRP